MSHGAGLQAQFHLRLLGEQVAPEDEPGIPIVGLAEGFLAGIVVIGVVVILVVLAAERNAPPGRSVEARAEVLQPALGIRLEEERREVAGFLLRLANRLLFEAAFREEGGKGNLREAHARLLAVTSNVRYSPESAPAPAGRCRAANGSATSTLAFPKPVWCVHSFWLPSERLRPSHGPSRALRLNTCESRSSSMSCGVPPRGRRGRDPGRPGSSS